MVTARRESLTCLPSTPARRSNLAGMAARKFHRYELRTKDVSAARAFYAEILGEDVWLGSELSVVPLPEHLVARGVPAHWLSHLSVDDVAASAAQFIARGAQQLGPAREQSVILRDPFGAALALSRETGEPRRGRVIFHGLEVHERDHERALAMYFELCGWTPTELVDLGAELGRHRGFAWDDSKRTIGKIGTITPHAAARGLHPQWVSHFGVADLEASLARVRALGGKVLGSLTLPNGELLGVCDDMYDAGFALCQQREHV